MGFPTLMSQFAGAAITEYHRKEFFHGSGGWKSKVGALAGWCVDDSSCHQALAWLFLCAHVEQEISGISSSPHEDTSPTGQAHPYDLI